MKKRFIFTAILINLFFFASYSKSPSSKFFSRANDFFKEYVENGMVDYKRHKKSPTDLNTLVSLISTINIEEENELVQKAYYINAYNVLLIKSIVDSYPVMLPLETKGLFSSLAYKIGLKYYTLNELEALLITRFKDMRVLFLLSSASVGSPKLASFAYEPKKLDKQLEERSKLVCNDKEFIRVAKNISTILMSESFKKAQKAFKKEEIITVINKVREEPLPSGYVLDFYPSNRRLNNKGTLGW